jgi:hypothetical protein
MHLTDPLRLFAIATGVLAITACVDSTSSPTELHSTSPDASRVKWVVVSPATAAIRSGATVTLNVQFQDASREKLDVSPPQWTSSDTTIAVVSDTGVVTGRKPGRAKIRVSAATQGAYAEVQVTAAPPPTVSVTVSPASVALAVPGTRQLSATVKLSTGSTVSNPAITWLSSNTKVATVSPAGLVTAVGAGSATITAQSGTGKGTSAVTVTTPAPSTPSQPSSSPPTAAPTQPPPATGSLFSGYSLTSPHWQHIRTMMTDFYYNWTPTERAWAGQHYDFAMSGDGSAWTAANATVQQYPYTLLWTTQIPGSVGVNITGAYYGDMVQWYAAHPGYHLENAWLHVRGVTPDSANRLVVHIWDSSRWILNAADAGARAYTADRYARIVSGHAGAFVDESGSGDIGSRVGNAAEFPDAASYMTAYAGLVATVKQAVGSKVIMLNTATYTTNADFADAVAAGAVHMEKANNPLHSGMPDQWMWVDKLLAAGVFVDFVNAYDYPDAVVLAPKYPAGNSTSTYERLKMWELASYYMVVPSSPDHLALQLVNMWNLPYSSLWLKAQEANIGHPTAARSIMLQGTDPTGQAYTIYSRDFDRALVLVRMQRGWGAQTYLDNTAVSVLLPAGETWLPLHGDGTLGAAVTSVTLRNSEAVILIKQRTIS